jgi:acyl carrier protein
MDVTEELKKVILSIGIDKQVVDTINPEWPLSGHVLDSLAYTEFVEALESHFGIRMLDRYSLRVTSLNEFAGLVTEMLEEQGGLAPSDI